MRISLFLVEGIIDFYLPSEISGSFSFDADDTESKLINVEARNGQWVLYSTSDVRIGDNNNFVDSIILVPNSFYVLKRDNQTHLVYVSNIRTSNTLTYKYGTNLNLTIGNSDTCNFKYNCPYLTNTTILLNIKNNQLYLQKQGNAIVYINKKAIKENPQVINVGDELQIYGLKIWVLNGVFFVNDDGNRLAINIAESNGVVSYVFPLEEPIQDQEVKDIDLYNKDDYFSKSPRIRRVVETKKIKLSSPPKEGESQEMPLILVIGPMLTMGAVSGVTLMNTVSKIGSGEATLEQSWPQLITSGIMLISMLVWPMVTQFYNRITKKRKKRHIIKKYTKYLNEKREELKKESQLQKNILLENLLTVDECINIIKHRSINFWDKRTDQSDFLMARIGLGNVPLDADIQYPDEEFTIDESEIKKKADELVEEFKYINNVPVGYSFYDNRTTAIMGGRFKAVNFMHNILLQLITFYSYEDLKIVVFTNEHNKKEWDYLKYLNHCFNNERSFRFFASDSESIKNVSEYLSFEINNRLNQSQQNNDNQFKPHYLILVDDYDKVKRQEFIKTITESDLNLGCSLIIVENKLSNLPSKCSNFITLGEKTSGVLKNSYEKQEQTSFSDEIHYNLNMMSLVKILSNIPIEFQDGIKDLPNSIAFLEMEKVGKVEQLNILNRWKINDSTTSLKAEVGVDEQGDLMYLDLHEKYHGPHGLIAGMTGSGKSEFIISYILSMAVNYSPDDVSFILIDYKGGGLAGAFENKVTGTILPHLAGTITNLDKAEMDRTLVSIDSEIKRRQKIFNEARDQLGESTIDIYKYQRFYKEGRLSKPVPHLFIICDEFAELKSQQPEFMDNLISVARIGRSLGVHLILATQKPSGVVNDQIWSNTKFRVCLKVQDESDSREMLKRPEAAALKQVGRFYLQVGYNELFALGQSAWCGAKYYPSEKIVKQVDKSINFIGDFGNPIKSIQAGGGIKIEAQGEQLAAIMRSIIGVSKDANKKARKLWLDNIPEIILVNDLEQKYSIIKQPYKVEAIIGEYDAPEKQEQGIVKYNYLEDGNTIIYGNDGTERELLLNTIIYSTAKNYSADEVNFYIIDYGSESLGKYAALPQVGGIVVAGEDEKYHNLLKLIKEELQTRKKLFMDFGGEYQNYIKNSQTKLPVKVIIINNYDSLYETYQEIYEEFPDLVRDSERYGIVYIFTANAINSVQNKISQNFHNVYAFKLKDSSDYASIFGTRTKLVPREINGRGLLNNNGIHEFQTASIVASDDELNEYLQSFIQMQKQVNKSKAGRIPTLPDIIRINDIQEEISTLNNVPIGISKKELEVCVVDYLANLGNIISSNKLANTKKFVLSLFEVLKSIPNTSLMIFDPLKLLCLNKELYPNYYTDKLDQVLDSITEYIQKLIDAKSQANGVILIYGLNKFISKVNDNSKIQNLCQLIKDYEKISLIVVDDGAKIKGYAFESWFTSIFNTSEGLWIGRGIADSSLLRLSNVTRDMTKDLKNNMGYYVNEGMATLIKLIDFLSKDEDDVDEK